jgi:glutamate-1-semialdehyde 2,1-aminomutase
MNKSLELYKEALKLFPGGVNSPVRAAVKPYPFYVEKADGAYIYTVDGERLIDLVLAYGPLILGHRHPEVEGKIAEQLTKGWIYGAPTEVEIKLAKKIIDHVMRNGMIRFVNSGSEATELAIRLARGYTKRKLIVKFDGCYHGAHDAVLVSAGSAAEHYGAPSSEGVLEEVAKNTLVIQFNDIEGLERVFKERGEEIAAVIIEPVMGNLGVIPPDPLFLKTLRELTEDYNSMLIFDEVITGFRLGLGGAKERYNIKADIVVLGKIIGGGFPIGAVVSRKEIMENISPLGKVFNAGTFNAHPISMTAGLATIEVLERDRDKIYPMISEAGAQIARAIEDAAGRAGIDVWVNRVESMLQVFFINKPVTNALIARMSNKNLYERFHVEMRKQGVFITPSQFEAIFTGLPHKNDVLEKIINAIYDSFRSMVSQDDNKSSNKKKQT